MHMVQVLLWLEEEATRLTKTIAIYMGGGLHSCEHMKIEVIK